MKSLIRNPRQAICIAAPPAVKHKEIPNVGENFFLTAAAASILLAPIVAAFAANSVSGWGDAIGSKPSVQLSVGMLVSVAEAAGMCSLKVVG